jgi:antitoxin component YwqK of YwqJK toxin-antitoxin module
MTLKTRKAVWRFALVVVLCVGCLGFVPRGYAESAFSYTDKQTEIKDPDRNAVIAGSNLVWVGKDEVGWDQIFSRNLETGELKQLSTSQTYKESLSASGDYSVYLENRQNMTFLNLQSGDATKIDVKPFFYEEPRTDGHYVTYYHNLETMLYVYDTATKEVKQIGKGKGATIVDGVVVYYSYPDGSIMLYDAQTAASRVLWKGKSAGYVVNTSQIDFNGKNVVWTQWFNNIYQTRILDVTEKDPSPKVLNEFQELPVGFVFKTPAIGTSIAAWPALDHGKAQVVAADLSSRQTGTVADNGELLIGVYREQLVLKDKDNKVVLRSLQPTGQGKVNKDTILGSAVPDFDSEKFTNATFGYLGQGGSSSISSSDKTVTISTNNSRPYPDGVRDASIYYQKDDDFMLTKGLKPGQKFVSHPWKLNITSPETPFTLSISYIVQKVPPGQEGKLGIYCLKSGEWTYAGGQLDLNNQRLQMAISQPGIYALLYHDVPNQLIRDYWQGKVIGQLNAAKPIRIFLDGEELTFHEQPVLKDGSTTVEFRPIFEKLGMQIDWDVTSQTVTGTKQGQSLKLTLGQSAAVINGSSSELPTAPFLNQGYTFVPLRFVGETTGRKVLWDPNLKAVYIYDPASEEKLFYDNGTLQYEGQLKDGKMNGKGKLYRKDGTLWYDAEFRDNEVTGLGTIYYSGWMGNRDRTGDMTIGQFKNGFPDGYVVSINDNGDIQYDGKEIQGLPNDKGKLYEDGQLIYDGEFKEGTPDGYGKSYRDGKLDYEGYFVDGVPNGHGKEYRNDGTVIREGEYVDGKFKK